jgi:broad specificity phosphatase PhoE
MIRGARLILVRHGETEGESSIRYHGRTDVPLSELGRAQMRLAGRALETRYGGVSFAGVFSSPLVRASEGARIVAGDWAPLVTIDEFAEVHFGLF